jgi:hypothetical protein
MTHFHSELECSNALQVHSRNLSHVGCMVALLQWEDEAQLEFIARHNYFCFNINILIKASFKTIKICDYYIR